MEGGGSSGETLFQRQLSGPKMVIPIQKGNLVGCFIELFFEKRTSSCLCRSLPLASSRMNALHAQRSTERCKKCGVTCGKRTCNFGDERGMDGRGIGKEETHIHTHTHVHSHIRVYTHVRVRTLALMNRHTCVSVNLRRWVYLYAIASFGLWKGL